MRVLLDECLPRGLKRELPRHDVRTAPEMGWTSKRNGELLQLAQREFDVFLTVDRNLRHQQNLTSFEIAVIVLGRTEQQVRGLAIADEHGSRESFDRETWRGARDRKP